jgi:hypothetical protein
MQKVTIMATATQTQAQISASDLLTRLVTGSVLTRSEIVDEFYSRFPLLDLGELTAKVDEAVEVKLAGEVFWPQTTDYDRLIQAFGELNATGLVALHSPAEGSDMCEFAAISEWMRHGGSTSDRIGFVFYDLKDVDEAVSHGQLLLGYACFEQHPGLHDLPLMQELIGHRVKDTLERHGLIVDWNGSTTEKIAVRLSWQKRGEADPCERVFTDPKLDMDDWELLCDRTDPSSNIQFC